MAVYASLVSLIHVINRHQNPPLPYAFLKILPTQPLNDQVSFLLDFVESYSQTRSKEIQLLESRIADAAYAAEDVIEGYRVLEIRERSGERVDEAYAKACEDLEKVVQEMDLIMKDVLKIKADSNEKNQKQQTKHSIEAAGRSSSSSSSKAGGKNTMVGFDDDLITLKEKLTTHQSDRLVIPIVGMGGIEWNSTEGEFQHLKSLTIIECDLKIWRADSVNFPALKRLGLRTEELEEIPWGIGEIPSLELIRLEYCKRSLVISAKEIHLNAQAQGNDDLIVQVCTYDKEFLVEPIDQGEPGTFQE